MEIIDTKNNTNQMNKHLILSKSPENRQSEKIVFDDDGDDAYLQPQRKYSLGLKEEDSIAYSSLMNALDDDDAMAKIRVYDPYKDTKNVVYY